jgi:pyruvate decarboxylase
VDDFHALAESCGYAVATAPNAKGLFPSSARQYMGTYWGPVSDTGCSEVVEAADACLLAGTTMTDYTTCGHQLGLEAPRLITVGPESVQLPGATYGGVRMRDFLAALRPRLTRNDGAVTAYDRIRPEPRPAAPDGAGPLTVRQLFDRVAALLDGNSTLLVETGDSWFNGIDVRLPDGARFEIQMQYGSIGWSTGATLGYAIGAPDRRVIACIGDGSFQMTAQEISTIIRYGARAIVFLINNGGYTIEVEIHDGPYNTIKNWRYAQLVDVFNADDGRGWSTRVATHAELDAAIAEARDRKGLSFIEVAIDRDDCNRNLLRWGNRVAHNNSRPPRIR